MRGSIITGGLVGVVLGAAAAFVLSQGLWLDADRSAGSSLAPRGPGADAAEMTLREDVPPRRPLRPGSQPSVATARS